MSYDNEVDYVNLEEQIFSLWHLWTHMDILEHFSKHMHVIYFPLFRTIKLQGCNQS